MKFNDEILKTIQSNSRRIMSTFLPSEISRLTYDYLSTHCGQKLADEFSKACPSMEECRQMKCKYRNFHTTVQDLTLETILDQYSKLCSTIFACFDEDKRKHRNVLNLLEMILKKHQREPSTSKSNRVFRDVQNVPSIRNLSDSHEARGRENKLSVPKVNGQISDMPRMSKETTNSPLQLTDRKNSVINELVSNLSKVSPDSRNASQTIDAGISSNLHEDQLAMNISNSRSNEISSHYKSQKSIPHLNRSVLETGQSVDSDLFTSPEGTDQHHISETVHSFMLEEVEPGLRENTESVLLEEPILTERNIEFDSANNETGQSSGIESSSGKMNQRNPRTTFHSLALTEAENPEFCSSQRGFYETQSATSACVDESCRGDEQTKTSSAEIEGNAIPLSESAENIPSSCSVPSSSIQADWKAIFCNSVKMSTTSKSEKMQTSRKTTSKSTGTPHKTKKANSSEESIQVLFENLSKNFKHRPHPYLSPAKSSRLLHQATLSPLSKMYVTPTKPNSLNAATSNHSVASNATSSSSIASSQRSIFSPIIVDTPCTKEIPARKLEKDYSEERPSTKESISGEKVLVKRKNNSRHKLQLSYAMNDEILKKMNKISNIEGLPSNTIDSKSAQNSKKVSIDCKDIRQDLVRNADMAQEKEKKSKKIKKDSKKSISRSKTKENHVENKQKVGEENTEEIVPRSIQTYNIEDIFRKMVVRVLVKDTYEIAELDISSEFLIYHRNSS